MTKMDNCLFLFPVESVSALEARLHRACDRNITPRFGRTIESTVFLCKVIITRIEIRALAAEAAAFRI